MCSIGPGDAGAEGGAAADGAADDGRDGGAAGDGPADWAAPPSDALPADGQRVDASTGDAAPADAPGPDAPPPDGPGDAPPDSGCMGPTSCAPGYACTAGTCSSLASGLVGYWKLDETTNGATAVDDSGSGFNAADVGGTTVSPSPDHPARFTNPNARRFSLSSDPTPDSLRVTAPGSRLKPLSWSMSVWFKATTTDILAGTIASLGDNYVLVLRPDGKAQATRRYSSSWFFCETTMTYLDGRWHHAVGTSVSGGALAIWVDGVKTSCPGNTVQSFDLGADLVIGRHGNGGADYDFDGTIDDLRIYNRVLDDSEIQALFAGQ